MKKSLNIIVKLILDISLFSLSIFLGFYLRFDGHIPLYYIRMFLLTLPIEILLIIFMFYRFNIFKTFWQYTSISDILNLFFALVIEKSIFAFFVYIFLDFPFIKNIIFKEEIFSGYPRSVLLISISLSLIFLSGIRGLWRIRSEKKVSKYELINHNKKNVLIIGAGDTGIMTLKELEKHKELNYNILGFLDDDIDKIGMFIHNKKVFGRIEEIDKIYEKFKIDEIIIAVPSIKTDVLKRLLDKIKGRTIIKIVQSFVDSLNEKNKLTRIRQLKIEDILKREEVDIDLSDVEDFIKDKIILVTGAGGSIGSKLSKKIVEFKPQRLILIDIKESELYMLKHEINLDFIKIILCDIRDKDKLESIFKNEKPQIVFHSAAYKHVPMMEEFPDEAIKTNIFGTLNLVEIADKYKVDKFIFISTDKAVKPKSIMGATKRIGELILKEYSNKSKTKFISVRFGNVFESNGSVIPLFINQIEKGGPLTVTDPEVERYFMTIDEAVKLILQASSMGKGGEIFVLDMGEPVKIIDIAKNLIKLYGYEPEKDIKIVFTGLRPGEKLKEELYYENEILIKTKHPKIFIIDQNNNNEKINLERLNKDTYNYIKSFIIT